MSVLDLDGYAVEFAQGRGGNVFSRAVYTPFWRGVLHHRWWVVDMHTGERSRATPRCPHRPP